MTDYSDLVERLRKAPKMWDGFLVENREGCFEGSIPTLEAADAIEWLVKEVTNLREMSVAEEVLANQIRKEIREDERQRCAKIAERFLSNNEPVRLTASSIAAAIRERSNER